MQSGTMRIGFRRLLGLAKEAGVDLRDLWSQPSSKKRRKGIYGAYRSFQGGLRIFWNEGEQRAQVEFIKRANVDFLGVWSLTNSGRELLAKVLRAAGIQNVWFIPAAPESMTSDAVVRIE